MPPIEFLSSRFHYSFGPHEPTLTVESGAALRVTCPDCDNTMADGQELSAESRCVEPGPGFIEGNPLAGPIRVTGAAPGDTLAVSIDAVDLDRDYGLTLLAPDHGVIPEDRINPSADSNRNGDVPRHMFRWRIDTGAGEATPENSLGRINLTVKLAPFVGCIGVCPADSKKVGSLYCGPFGGNLDLPFIRPGTTVFLPVFHDGALLMLGDVHAAQGDGEIIGGAIETSGKIDCKIRVLKDTRIGTCRARDDERIYVIGTHDELRQAIQVACGGLVDWLASIGPADRYDLFNLVSQTVSITVGNLNEPPYSAAASIRFDQLPEVVEEAVLKWIG